MKVQEEFGIINDQPLSVNDHSLNFGVITTKNIKEYFERVNVFITGSTGFMGKVLIAKLLQSCQGIDKIYILLRSKRGLECKTRFQNFIGNKVFDKVRAENPGTFSKLAFVTGDISEHNLGLSEDDQKILENKVNIVFHMAATIRFTEPLKEAANLNTFGTQRVMELCLRMKALKVLADFKFYLMSVPK